MCFPYFGPREGRALGLSRRGAHPQLCSSGGWRRDVGLCVQVSVRRRLGALQSLSAAPPVQTAWDSSWLSLGRSLYYNEIDKT